MVVGLVATGVECRQGPRVGGTTDVPAAGPGGLDDDPIRQTDLADPFPRLGPGAARWLSVAVDWVAGDGRTLGAVMSDAASALIGN